MAGLGLAALCWIYFAILLGWLGLYLLTGDRYGPVALVHSLAVYLFVPLPLVFAAAALTRRRELWIGVAAGGALFAALWGRHFFPRVVPARAGTQVLSVFTYNTLGAQPHTGPILEVIRAENADVVCLQELNPALARAVQSELTGLYPHQLLDPKPYVPGMGVLSKLPFSVVAEPLPSEWLGAPQRLRLDWNGRTVTLINFHLFSQSLGAPAEMDSLNRARETQARVLAQAARAEAEAGAVIACGDANTTPLSEAYKMMTRDLNDAWDEAGAGLGHTFPGSDIRGSSRPRIGGWLVPQWLVRIDYVFHSPHLKAVDAHLAAFDGVSDHRGVVALLTPTK
jgi:vancomycin resistance protein VanJ